MDERINLLWIKKINNIWRYVLDSSVAGWEPVAGFYKCSHEFSVSIKQRMYEAFVKILVSKE